MWVQREHESVCERKKGENACVCVREYKLNQESVYSVPVCERGGEGGREREGGGEREKVRGA